VIANEARVIANEARVITNAPFVIANANEVIIHEERMHSEAAGVIRNEDRQIRRTSKP
jgi:hypothetical protein